MVSNFPRSQSLEAMGPEFKLSFDTKALSSPLSQLSNERIQELCSHSQLPSWGGGGVKCGDNQARFTFLGIFSHPWFSILIFRVKNSYFVSSEADKAGFEFHLHYFPAGGQVDLL